MSHFMFKKFLVHNLPIFLDIYRGTIYCSFQDKEGNTELQWPLVLSLCVVLLRFHLRHSLGIKDSRNGRLLPQLLRV